MFQTIDQSKKCLNAFEQDSTLVAVVELSQKSWLVAGIVPGVDRHPLKKFDADENRLLALIQRWKQEAIKAGREVKRIVVAFEAGRDGFWLARWLQARGIEVCVIHPTSVSVPREQRRAKTDRLDTELLKRATLGWLRGEPDHCRMVAIPTLEEEDAKRSNREHQYLVGERTRLVNRLKAALARLGVRNFNPKLRKASERLRALVTPEGKPLPPNTLAEMERDMQRLQFVKQQIKAIEQTRFERLKKAPKTRLNMMVLLVARVLGMGIETADMLVHEVLWRDLRDRRAVAQLCRSYRGAGRKRGPAAGERSGTSRQRAGAPRHD